jgi:hypothetical protein
MDGWHLGDRWLRRGVSWLRASFVGCHGSGMIPEIEAKGIRSLSRTPYRPLLPAVLWW